MRQTTLHLIVGLVIGMTSAGRPARADDLDAETVRHVRSSNASIVALIGLATQQSGTFRSLIETINASEGIVYVEKGRCGRGVRALCP